MLILQLPFLLSQFLNSAGNNHDFREICRVHCYDRIDFFRDKVDQQSSFVCNIWLIWRINECPLDFIYDVVKVFIVSEIDGLPVAEFLDPMVVNDLQIENIIKNNEKDLSNLDETVVCNILTGDVIEEH